LQGPKRVISAISIGPAISKSPAASQSDAPPLQSLFGSPALSILLSLPNSLANPPGTLKSLQCTTKRAAFLAPSRQTSVMPEQRDPVPGQRFLLVQCGEKSCRDRFYWPSTIGYVSLTSDVQTRSMADAGTVAEAGRARCSPSMRALQLRYGSCRQFGFLRFTGLILGRGLKSLRSCIGLADSCTREISSLRASADWALSFSSG
jgi:hypothetical protein